MPYVDKLKFRNTTKDTPVSQQEQGVASPLPKPSGRTRQDSLGDAESDPWASPEAHRGHNHATENTIAPPLNGFSGPTRSTANGFSAKPTGGFHDQAEGHNDGSPSGRTTEPPPGSAGSGWGDGYGNPPGGGFGSTGQSGHGGGFGQSGDDQGHSNPNNITRSLGGGRMTGQGAEEVITITLLPEKEGMFMFQHRNYEVKSTRRGSSVIRRYSDFVWLVDCLQKRYPFRQIPLLPPKRVAGT